MTTLTDRYVWAAVRTVPDAQRAEIEPEIREMIGDAVDARRTAGEDSGAAERSALTELGDPERLAADYVGRPLTLIGPRYYLDWWRLLKTVTLIVVPISAAAVLGAQLLGTGDIGDAIGSAVSTALGVTVHLAFWITLVFVIIERSGTTEPGASWSPETLPALPDRSRHARRPELIASLVFLAALAGAVLWQQASSVVRTATGSAIPFLDPALWSFWLPWLFGLLVAEAAFAVWLYLRDWSWAAAVVNLGLALAFAVPVVLLWSEGRLLNPDFVDAVGWGPAVAPGESGTIVPLVSVAITILAGWDVVDGFLKARRASGDPARQPALTHH